ncbi:MAG: BrnT family toxin [Desulfococcaceae bacterium]
MKRFDWNDEKNEWLKRLRGLSFEQAVFCLTNGGLLDVYDHPNTERYEGQRVFVVKIEAYAYLVPFVEDDEVVFLKTIIPSRKMTKRYLSDG